MARTQEGAAVTNNHRDALRQLRASYLRDLLRVWNMFDAGSIETFRQEFLPLAVQLTRTHHQDAATLAMRYYRSFRAAEQIPGEPAAVEAPQLPRPRIETAFSATALPGYFRALQAGKSPRQAKQDAYVRASGAGERLVRRGSVDTITASMRADNSALGWQRITDDDPCYFCAMLASRGGVYSEATVDFQAHDHDQCSAEPVYEGGGDRNRQLSDLWQETTQGLSGQDAIRAFRRAYEGGGA